MAESWTLRKQGRKNVDPFEPWCLRRILHIPWMVWITNASVLKLAEIKALVVRQKLSYISDIMRKKDGLKSETTGTPTCQSNIGSVCYGHCLFLRFKSGKNKLNAQFCVPNYNCYYIIGHPPKNKIYVVCFYTKTITLHISFRLGFWRKVGIEVGVHCTVQFLYQSVWTKKL